MTNITRRRFIALLPGIAFAFRTPGAEAESSVVALPGWKSLPVLELYRAEPYLTMAVGLQKLGPKARLDMLMRIAKEEKKGAKDESEGDIRTAILCRMLFTARKGGRFDCPPLGGPDFFAGSNFHDWPLEPIEIVDGVPFAITYSFEIAGERIEPWRERYVDYCARECDWSPVRYAMKSPRELQAALNKLARDKRWTLKFLPDEWKYLSSQV